MWDLEAGYLIKVKNFLAPENKQSIRVILLTVLKSTFNITHKIRKFVHTLRIYIKITNIFKKGY